MNELLYLQVLILVEFALYCAQVHWVFDDIEVIRDVQLFRVYGLVENPRLLMLPQLIDHPLGCFLPAIDYRGLFRHRRHWNALNDII